jgi:hypothetical protein
MLKFGKLPPKNSLKALHLSKYLTDLSVPAKVYWEYKVPDDLWGMFSNDTIGDCTCAAIAHMLMMFTAHTGKMVTPEVSDVIKAYSAVSGYDPTTGFNDNGAAIVDVLEYWQTIGIAGHKILGFAKIDNTNIQQMQKAIWLFGAADLGVNLPSAAEDQFFADEAWDLTKKDGPIQGGHSVPVFGYGRLGQTCITWGKRQPMSWDWTRKYCDEAYTVITQDWINRATSKAPSGFDLETLKSDLAAMTT